MKFQQKNDSFQMISQISNIMGQVKYIVLSKERVKL